LEVVSSGLLESVLAGISPDVVLDNGETVPVDYSLRNAVVDLTKFSDFQEVSKRFSAASLRPVSYNGSVYAMPQTFDFYMFFYRTDLFDEYGFSVPKTWTELYKMIPALQRNGLGVGIPHDLNMYTTLLYQNSGELYKNDGLETNLSSNIAVKTFIDFCEIFTLYDCSVSYDFANRFRSGEMPCGIAAYSQYNQLTAFAPEIKGLWEMVPIPGTVQSDGNINNISVGGGSFMMLMQSSSNKELAWEFMKWYMSADIQSQYAIKMESILGNCAKVNSANVEALSKMTWSSKEYKNLFSQLQNVGAVPQVPGGYYLSRIVSFAFNRVYNKSEDPAEVITSYVKELNEELERKHQEFEKEE
jgi:ABC-type glycerol-3-phosphate transport system substrate-binding protein